MNLMNETTPHYMSDTYHLTVVRYFCPCTQYERSIHFPIIVIIITPLDGAQCCSWPETFNVSSTELFTFWKHDSPSEKDLGDEIKTQKGLSPLDRKEKNHDKTLVGRVIDNNGLKTHADSVSLVTMFKIFNNNCPTYLREQFHRTSEIHDYNLRGSNYDLQLPLPKTNFLKRSFSYRGAMAWNQLSNKTREIGDLTSFKLAIS